MQQNRGFTKVSGLILILLVILGGGYIYYQKFYTKPVLVPVAETSTDNSETDIKSEVNIQTQVNIQQCKDVRDLQARYDCYINLATTNGAQICEASPMKKYCYEQVATKKGDYTICQEMNDSDYNKDACMFAVMLNTSNYSICDAMTSIGLESPKANCYIVASLRTRDSKYCEKIAIASEKEYCLKNLSLFQQNQ
ncbi:MAG: hypothetical protein Q7T49_00500 [bacterium]|nr:hypothetical protein [bacterium]